MEQKFKRTNIDLTEKMDEAVIRKQKRMAKSLGGIRPTKAQVIQHFCKVGMKREGYEVE